MNTPMTVGQRIDRAIEELNAGAVDYAQASALIAIAQLLEAQQADHGVACECDAQNSDYAFGCPVHSDGSLEDPTIWNHPDWVPTEPQMDAARRAITGPVADVALARERPSDAVLNEIILTVVLAIRKQR